MENYQLYRTNVKLGGQMKMDLIVSPFDGGNANDTDLIVTDFHLSPISPYVPFNKLVNDYSLNYNHSDNITMFYKKISSNFYNCKVNPLYTNEFPIVSNKANLDIHDSTYEMGCRRMQYSLYKKQFEFLCPLWLEHLEEGHNLEFELQVFTNSSSLHPISSRTLKLKTTNSQDYHNKFVNYFNDHLKKVGVLGERGNDEIMSIYLHQNQATIAGLSVLNGDVKIKNLPNLVTNLTSREIPMMDFDNQIIEQFSNNKLISNQLYNFNICFNIDDLLHPTLRSQLMGKKLVIKMNVKYNGEILEKVDFYSNYEYIPRKRSDYTYNIKYPIKQSSIVNIISTDKSGAPNVLDYLKDNKFVDLIRKNKLSQDIIHWSLYDNNDYIFNIYKGFYGYSFDEKGNIVNHENYLYDNEPDLQVQEYSVTKNNSNWCNILLSLIDDQTFTNFIRDISTNPQNYEKYFTKFSKGITWVNNVKYIINDNTFDDKNVYVMSIVSKNNIQNISGFAIDNVKFLSNSVDDKLFIILLTNDISNITYSKIKSKPSNNEYINILKTILDSVNSTINPPMIGILNTVDLQLADSPSLNSSEITYYKNNKSGGIVLRYSGKIKPTFVKSSNDINFNYTYSKLLVNDQNYGQYLKYKSTGYLPQYPSIGYTDIVNMGKTIYEDKNKILNPDKIEYSIYKDSICYNLLPDISTTIDSEKDENENYVKLKELVKNYIGELYNIQDNDVLDYIYSLYDYKSSFDYKELDNINDYIYNVEIKLK